MPPRDVLPATFKAPLTEAFAFTTKLPPTLALPATVIELTEISPPILAVKPVRLEPSPKKAEAQTLSLTTKSLVIVAVPSTRKAVLTIILFVATFNAVLVPSPV